MTRKAKWDFGELLLPMPFLLLVVCLSGCVYAKQPSSAPIEIKLKIDAPHPQQYSVRVTQQSTNDYAIGRDGLVQFPVPMFQNGCDVYLFRYIKIRDGSARNAAIIQVRNGELAVRKLSIAQCETLPRTETGYKVIDMAEQP